MSVKLLSNIYVGFDINKNSTGTSILNESGELIFEDIFTGCKDIAFDSVEALGIYQDYFEEVFFECKDSTSVSIFIEKPFVNIKRQDLSLFLARVTGLCAYTFYDNCKSFGMSSFSVRWLNNMSLKKFITGDGHSPKEKIRDTIEGTYGRPEKMSAPHRSDRADSIAVAYMGLWCHLFLNDQKKLKKLPNWDYILDDRKRIALK